MATITKRLCLQVGSYEQNGRVKAEYREIGVEMEFSDQRGNKWTEVKLNADLLPPSLLALAKRFMEPTGSTVRVKKFDVSRRSQTPDTADGPPGEEEIENPF